VIGSTPVDASDLINASNGDTGNQLRYDATAQKWIYNLATANFTGMGTYTIRIQSGDDTDYTLPASCVAQLVRQP